MRRCLVYKCCHRQNPKERYQISSHHNSASAMYQTFVAPFHTPEDPQCMLNSAMALERSLDELMPLIEATENLHKRNKNIDMQYRAKGDLEIYQDLGAKVDKTSKHKGTLRATQRQVQNFTARTRATLYEDSAIERPAGVATVGPNFEVPTAISTESASNRISASAALVFLRLGKFSDVAGRFQSLSYVHSRH